jgi:hypothetical protein
MSRQAALRTIHLEPTDRIPHWEMLSHPEFERALTGIDPYEHPQRSKLRMIELLDLAVDSAPLEDAPLPRPAAEPAAEPAEGRRRDRVRWGAGSTWTWNHRRCETLEEMFAFEPMEQLWRPDSGFYFEDSEDLQPFFGQGPEALAESFRTVYRRRQEVVGERCLALFGFYRTLVMWVLMLFDWELFLQAVGLYPEKLGELLDRFGEMNLRIFEALASTDAPLIYSHDDICMTAGPVCNPQFYRRYVYPWYERFWSILRARGKKVIFFSDGNVDAVADDIFACGADGIYGEPYTDLGTIARRYGQRKILWGNMDNRVLMSGDREAIRAEVDRCTAFGRECPGYFYGVTNHLPWNVPVDSMRFYFDYCREAGRR